MADRWIITTREYMQHPTLRAAEHELARLSALCPDKKFTMRRVKSALEASRDKVALGEEINRLRARITELELASIQPFTDAAE